MFKQKIFSFFKSYGVYNEAEEKIFTIEGRLSLGQKFQIYDANEVECGVIMKKVFNFFPVYEIYRGNAHAGYSLIGEIKYKPSLFKTDFEVDFNGWRVCGDWLAWDFVVRNRNNVPIAVISKEHLHLKDTYSVELDDSQDLFEMISVIVVADLLHDVRHD